MIDASVLVDLLANTDYAEAARRRLRSSSLHAPAHLDAEVLSALGRLHRADQLAADDVEAGLTHLIRLRLTRHPVPDLLLGAWARRDNLRLVDALYVELATRLDVRLVTTDQRLAAVTPRAEAISA